VARPAAGTEARQGLGQDSAADEVDQVLVEPQRDPGGVPVRRRP
jgi:hypothetical protein